MERISAISVIEKRFIKINSSLDLVLANYAIEDIHHFRIEIKKLKAFLHLLKLGSNNAPAFKLPPGIKRFYKVIGNVRSLQLQQDRFKEMAGGADAYLPSKYVGELNKKEKANIVKAKNLIRSKEPFIKEKDHLISGLKEKNENIKEKEFLKSAIASLNQHLSSGNPSDKTLHSIRKILKDILYTQPFIKIKIKSVPLSMLPDHSNLKLLSTLLGDFQDIYTGLKLLHAHGADNLPEPERIFLMNVEKEWKEEKEEIRKKVMDQLKATGLIPIIS